MLKGIVPRLYQQTIFSTVANSDTLVVLPTGLGKSLISMMLCVNQLIKFPEKKVLMLAPTKPLCEQHVGSFRKHLDIDSDSIVLFTGSVGPKKRAELWKSARVIISTCQSIENDVISNRVDLSEVSCIVFDEAHRATGNYSYVWVCKRFKQLCPNGRVLAMTASPGSELKVIQEVCLNMHVENIEVRTPKDPDVAGYIQEVKSDYIEVAFPAAYKEVHDRLKVCLKRKLEGIVKLGLLNKVDLTKGQILLLQRKLQGKLRSGVDYDVMKALSLLAEALKVEHSLGLIESQGAGPCHRYVSELLKSASSSKVKAVRNLSWDSDFKAAYVLLEKLVNSGVRHPKHERLSSLIYSKIVGFPLAKFLVFTELRDSAVEIETVLNELGVSCCVFVGQAKKRGIGLTQKQQKEVLDRFRAGEFSVLVATSVAEEGLDIPSVDGVLFFEPTPSAVRTIQRRGRTGRHEEGFVSVFVCKGTRDEAYRWAAFHKERRMYQFLEQLKRDKSLLLPKKDSVVSSQVGLDEYSGKKENISAETSSRDENKKNKKEIEKEKKKNESEEVETATPRAQTPHLRRATGHAPPGHTTINCVNNGIDGTDAVSTTSNSVGAGVGDRSSSGSGVGFEAGVGADGDLGVGVEGSENLGPVVLCDHREKQNLVLKSLIDLGCRVSLEQLSVADYVVGGDIGVELKKIPDFVNSLVDGRLISQIAKLRDAFKKPVLIVEGTQDIYSVRRVHANAIRGAIAAIGIGFSVPIIYTKDEKDTAEMLYFLAKRGQSGGGEKVLHVEKPQSVNEGAEYIVSCLPGVGPKLARKLLASFGSVRGVLLASKEELLAVPGLGKKICDKIFGVLDLEYGEE